MAPPMLPLHGFKRLRGKVPENLVVRKPVPRDTKEKVILTSQGKAFRKWTEGEVSPCGC
jgi:hypothetical protein